MIYIPFSCTELIGLSSHHPQRVWPKVILGLLLSGSTCLSATQAAKLDPLNMQFHGFINQGYIKTDDNQFFGDSENGSWEFTDIGIGASSKLSSNLQVSVQALYRRAGRTSPDGVQIDYALADWSLMNEADIGLGLRAGRIKIPFGFYNETRDIASSRPSILLPESIYVDALRELFHTVDGAGFYMYKSWDNTLLTFDTAFGEPSISRVTQDVILTAPIPGKLENEKLGAARLVLEEHSGLWRIAYSHVELEADYQPATIDLAVAGSTSITLNLVSVEYNWSNWQFSGERQLREITYQGILHDGFNHTLSADSYYIQTSYRINQKWHLLLRYDRTYMDKHDKAGENFNFSSDAYAKDWTIGVRFQPSSPWLLSAELHKINGTAWLPRIENPAEPDSNWFLFTAQVSWRF